MIPADTEEVEAPSAEATDMAAEEAAIENDKSRRIYYGTQTDAASGIPSSV